MVDIAEINEHYLRNSSEIKNNLDKELISKLKAGEQLDLSNCNLNFLISQIRGTIQIIEREYILGLKNTLEKQNIPFEQINSILQNIETNNSENKKLLSFYLNNIDCLMQQLQSQIRTSPAFEGYKNGKKPRKKSQYQIDSENIAKKIWAEDKMLSTEHVAQEIIFKLDLSQSLTTVKGWIKPLDPLLGTGVKRKRQSKKK
ncbi:hypothetical protein [Pasteurella multocida]|uniref:hypothetical protein n=2 Tax=Pasteurella multocida TaxID=747 RepID=UPI002B45DE4D|nr:hypothetical protein [Pasteurella multocida]WRK03685.1 hypothetical protein RFF39_03280 [Pasteurella multocida]HDR1304758.1 hypothetical protein [Pasteurella multocida]HDR1800064.1 hypothetical protein [Pasteurella multocida]